MKESDVQVIHKPWGREVLLYEPNQEEIDLGNGYCYKRIYINAGHRTSYQFHREKKETNYIVSGICEVWLENGLGVIEKKVMKQDEFFTVEPGKKHRVIALTDLVLQEVSTSHIHDIVRIEDDTNRKDGKIEGEWKNG